MSTYILAIGEPPQHFLVQREQDADGRRGWVVRQYDDPPEGEPFLMLLSGLHRTMRDAKADARRIAQERDAGSHRDCDICEQP